MSDELILEPAELTDVELDLVTGGAGTAAAGAGDNFAFAAAANVLIVETHGGTTIAVGNLSLALAG